MSLGTVRRAVVKVGSAVLTEGGSLSWDALARLVRQTASLRLRGVETLLVVSGAVAAGYRGLGLDEPPREVVDRQAAASIGQPKLLAMLSGLFSAQGLEIAQLLLSAEDIEDRRRFLSARHTVQRLLAQGVVPVINENDAVSDDEIKVGDNDHLAALVAQLSSADLLVMLSTVDGVRRDGGEGPRFASISAGENVDEHLGENRSSTGVGGMQAKVAAARLASRHGTPALIARGDVADVLELALRGADVGTWFPPAEHGLTARKRWIAVRSRSRGALIVDAGAARALRDRGASLLARGIVAVEGEFTRGARVEIRDAEGACFAVGLASYDAREIERVAGASAEAFHDLLGYRYVDEIVHRDDLVLLSEAQVRELS
ncbi:hypothetical protein ABI59_22710 [Acidobacteria bacterium Mor1]|nr:hypothetical protein ABI59_22710 [Acidobacteria bacterium Mor1]